ncbi:MAG: DNA methyltransferase [Thermodesulfobacteriota bacterium]
MESQVISKKRVADHGEVLTGNREVNAMLDLVKQETERIESRFLEPACGTGNFLVVILERKLSVVEKRYGQSQHDFERYAVLAVSSIYGVDILKDNVEHCRQRLFGIFDLVYLRLFKHKTNDDCREAVRFILEKNIIWGDALDLKTKDEPRVPIRFCEWSPVNGSMLKRRDFMLSFLVEKQHQMLLFSDEGNVADLNEPVREYPPVHFLEIAHAQQ